MLLWLGLFSLLVCDSGCGGQSLPSSVVYIGDGVTHRVTQPNSNIQTFVDAELAYCFSSSRPLYGPHLNTIEGENTTEALKSLACHSLYTFRYQFGFNYEFAFELPAMLSY